MIYIQVSVRNVILKPQVQDSFFCKILLLIKLETLYFCVMFRFLTNFAFNFTFSGVYKLICTKKYSFRKPSASSSNFMQYNWISLWSPFFYFLPARLRTVNYYLSFSPNKTKLTTMVWLTEVHGEGIKTSKLAALC